MTKQQCKIGYQDSYEVIKCHNIYKDSKVGSYPKKNKKKNKETKKEKNAKEKYLEEQEALRKEFEKKNKNKNKNKNNNKMEERENELNESQLFQAIRNLRSAQPVPLTQSNIAPERQKLRRMRAVMQN